MDKSEFESLLARLQESGRHLLKADGLVFGALLTLAALFKPEPAQVLGLAMTGVWPIKFLVWLMAGLVVYEAFVVTAGRDNLPAENIRLANFFRVLYFALVVLHTMALVYTAGYVVGFLESRGARLTNYRDASQAERSMSPVYWVQRADEVSV